MNTLVNILPYIQLTLSVLIIISVLLQHSEAGAGGSFGGGDNWNNAYHTRRGFEKFTFNSTIVLGVLFAVSAILALFFK